MVMKQRSIGLATGVAGVAVSLLAGACSLSFPLGGFVDKAPTGSIREAGGQNLLSPALDREDLRRADAALTVALDPQGSGTSVVWANPDSGAGGAFVALAPPLPDHDGICRAFGGDLRVHARPKRNFKGSACRSADGSWAIVSLTSGP